ncbi:hypothetical protein WJX81_006262 [Elliptochloris bilobata]|uniref:LysM domain-containing protein n=1 Tax=Elliptochloris bilobata TaxID=381761 RepID=A0AAW1SGH7_9CHLO
MLASKALGSAPRRTTLRTVSGKARPGRAQRCITSSITVRPYTVRKGDTLQSIAEKREIEVGQLTKLNHDRNPENLKEGQTILLPAGKLSFRDKEILAGIGSGNYRTYPVRENETIADIISKRNITRAEVDALNQGVNLNKLGENQLIKLPAGKYTVREREMLTGTAGAPSEYFMPGNPFSNSLILVLVAGVAYSAWLFRQREPDEEGEEELA